ncbi:kinase-like domain-containing protein [Dichotomocladium elegans]|nr:kinase-like domain-containing protein [Dichotomocladium elegans]
MLKGKQLERGVQALVKSLFPGCTVTGLRRVSGALTNAVFFVKVGHSSTLLLRVYGVGSDALVDRSNELLWLNRLAHLNMGPRLLATFGNGRFEEFLPSTTLTHDDLRNPALSLQIARQLRKLHALIHLYPPPPATDQKPAELTVWRSIDQWYSALTLHGYDLLQLGREIEQCKAILENTSPVVFGHNDLQYGNILKRKGTADELVLVDYEYAGYNPRAFDLANHFIEWTYDYHGDTPAYMIREALPSKEQRIAFLAAYGQQDVPVNVLLKETDLWFMAVHLHWGLWGMVQAISSKIDFDYKGYAAERLDAFRRELQRVLKTK